ncbi:DUF2829 domain-containing protein [Parabacteroides sp.]
MKKYIGTKQIEAEPMTLGEAHDRGFLQVKRVFEDGERDNDGYHVKYQDGYESWSPKDVFEKAYQVAETHIDRLCIEKKDLAEKFEKCSAFVRSDKFREVVKDDIQAFLLVLQRELMGRYNQVLDYRLFEKSFYMEHMSFGMAIEALKFGLAIRRKGWNGKGLFVVKQIPAHITEEIIPKMQSLPQSAKDIIMSRENKVIDYTSQMLIINPDGRADSWVPSVSDVFAEDWEIVL